MDKLRSSISLSTSVLPQSLTKSSSPTIIPDSKEIIFHDTINESSSTSSTSPTGRASSDGGIRPSTRVLHTAVLELILAADPDATISEYKLSTAKDLVKSHKFSNTKVVSPEVLTRAAGYGLRKHLAIHAGKESLDERWQEIKSKDVEEHGGEDLEYPDTLVVATTWDSRKNSGLDSGYDTESEDNTAKAIVSKIWSLKKQIIIGEVVWHHVDCL
ncbi:MAG: hypothetical protein Q9160_006086 [Pyrenula sp. 1 TL-2023]